VQARFARADVTIAGRTAHWTRNGDSGGSATFGFCPICASTVFWEPEGADFIYVAVEAFADPSFPPPHVSVYEERQHPWALAVKELPLEHQF
jgi:hypothetical protein